MAHGTTASMVTPTNTYGGYGRSTRSVSPSPHAGRLLDRPAAPRPTSLAVEAARLELQQIREQYGETPLLMTVKHIAAVLQISEGEVERMAGTGDLPCVRIGRRLRFPRQAIEQWIEDLIRDQLGEQWLAGRAEGLA